MNRLPIFLIMFSAICPPWNISAEILIPPDDPGINFYGRFDKSNAAASVGFNWPGSIIEAAFTGSSIGVELDDGEGSYFNVEIDGKIVDTITPSTVTRRIIKTGLSQDAGHTIRIILRTNGKNCSFGGFYLDDDNNLTDKPSQPLRKMEFIGDSWTAGDVVGSTTSNDLQYFNAALTYARMTSKAFHAQDMLIARGGCGLVNGYGAVMEERYPQTLCDVSGEWDFSSWIPDVVVMFLGINDFNNAASDDQFAAAYQRLITTVRNNYGEVPIVLIGLNESINGHDHLSNIRDIARSFSDVTIFSSPVTLGNAQALWQHPTPSQHKEIADSLIPVISEVTGWDTVPPVVVEHPQLMNTSFKHRRYRTHTFITTTGNTVALPPGMNGSRSNVTVHDCRGRRIHRIVTNKQKTVLPEVSTHSTGLYLITIEKM